MDPSHPDYELVQAMRQRLLDEIKRGGGATSVVNNVYGSGGGVSSGGGGLRGAMAEEAYQPDERDYLVDIMREDLGINPETGKPRGWKKRVHRFTVEKKKTDPTGWAE